MEFFSKNLRIMRECLNKRVDGFLSDEKMYTFKLSCIGIGSLIITYVIHRKLQSKDDHIEKTPMRIDIAYNGFELPSRKVRAGTVEGWFQITLLKFILHSPFKSLYLSWKSKRRGYKLLQQFSLPEGPTFMPCVDPGTALYREHNTTNNDVWKLVKTENDSDGFKFRSISALVEGYREGRFTPTDIAHKIMQCLEDISNLNVNLNAIIEYHKKLILEAAEVSTRRWKAGKPLSVFDGIPVAVKDQYFVDGYHCRNGTPLDIFGDIRSSSDEAGLVKFLREGGAVFIGMTQMPQFGASLFSINLSKYHGTCVSPYNTSYTAGGSSGGSACAVALGLCPVALGTDAGGSIRYPAACCGIIGLKSTFSQLSSEGMVMNGGTVGHSGPLCCSVRDAAIAYGFLATHSGKCFTWPKLEEVKNTKQKKKIGIDWELINICDEEVRLLLQSAIKTIEKDLSYEIKSIHIPEKQESFIGFAAMITMEMGEENHRIYMNHSKKINVFNTMLYGLGHTLSFQTYMQAAKQRTRAINAFQYLFTQVDAIFLPAAACHPLKVTETRKKYGCSDGHCGSSIKRMTFYGNFTGTPCITLPVAYSKQNLPVSLQIMVPWWREGRLLDIAYQVENLFEKRKPRYFYDILP